MQYAFTFNSGFGIVMFKFDTTESAGCWNETQKDVLNLTITRRNIT
jgi:hypothetical protein